MGLFKKIRRKVKRAVKKVVSKAPRIITGVATGGLSEVARVAGGSTGKELAKTAEGVFAPKSLKGGIRTAALVAAPVTGGLSLAGLALTQPQAPQPIVEEEDMGLGNVLGGLQGVLSQVGQFGGPIGTVAQIGSGFLSGFLPARGPTAAGFPASQFPQAVQTMAAAPIFQGAASAITGFVGPILAKMSVALGRSISLRAAMIIIRRLGKTLTSPQAVAAAIGLTSAELASLLTASAIRGSSGRRMNPGNVKALRRAHRRIKSFHKLCGENDRLRAPRRRTSPKVINVKGGICN